MRTRFDWLPPYREKRVGEAAHSGPRDRNPARRADVDLRERPGLGSVTKAHRARLIAELRTFAASRGDDLAVLFAGGVEAVVSLLRDFGQSLFRHGRSLGDYRETINAVAGLRRGWRSLLTGAWDSVSEPVDHHVPLTKVVFQTGIAVALLLGDKPRLPVLLPPHAVLEHLALR